MRVDEVTWTMGGDTDQALKMIMKSIQSSKTMDQLKTAKKLVQTFLKKAGDKASDYSKITNDALKKREQDIKG